MTNPARILVVEDQRLIAADIENTLKRLGYTIAGSVATGEEAVPAAMQLAPDLILMDVRLRGKMDGIEAATQIRATFDVPIVYLTANADEETILRAKSTAPYGYVIKPFNERELRAAIEIALYRHQIEQQLADERARRHAAEQASRVKDEFLQIAAHELKTPLTPLQLQLDSLLRAFEEAGIDDARIPAKLQTALRQTRRLTNLVESLLDVTRITSGHLELAIEEIDIAKLVADVVDRLRADAGRVGSQLVLRAEHGIHASCDRARVDASVSNLVSNALKYGAGKPVDVIVAARDDEAHIQVVDRGIGIEAQAMARIFGRFERAVSMRHFGGLGLGLFISRHYAEAHGGTIRVESQVGVGSTFTLVLPLHRQTG